ncbi:hypothetical protein TcasGA2_TC013224 [Tribolium castaneum]|uniref:Uncharacterized protein n=1 Tax=Tribolium castaneum TaxID=7070 RepID=D6WMK3_TRICA|nr:hypothetical protein TcasGA2_TC013224 [Tribolium castaneum]
MTILATPLRQLVVLLLYPRLAEDRLEGMCRGAISRRVEVVVVLASRHQREESRGCGAPDIDLSLGVCSTIGWLEGASAMSGP